MVSPDNVLQHIWKPKKARYHLNICLVVKFHQWYQCGCLYLLCKIFLQAFVKMLLFGDIKFDVSTILRVLMFVCRLPTTHLTCQKLMFSYRYPHMAAPGDKKHNVSAESSVLKKVSNMYLVTVYIALYSNIHFNCVIE